MVNLFADTAVTLPTSGDFWSPTGWGDFASKVGIPTFLLVFSVGVNVVLVWLMLKRLTGPTNQDQVNYLAELWKDAQERNRRLRCVLRQFCGVVATFATKSGVDCHEQLERIQDALDATPPPIPNTLFSSSDTKHDGT